MKYWSILLLAMVVVACNGDAPSESGNDNDGVDTAESGIIEYDMNEDRLSAVDYNNKLSLIQTRVFDQINILFKSDTASAQINYENTLFEVGLSLQDLKTVPSPKDGEAFKAALINLISFYKTQLDSEFAAIIPLLEKTVDERTTEEQRQLDLYDVSFAKREQVYFSKVMEAQEAFATANNFKIQ